MFLEIALMEKLVFTLGQPTKSISFCLAALLAGTGAGSVLAARIFRGTPGERGRRLGAWFVAISIAELFLYFGLSTLQSTILGYSARLQYALTLPIPFILGFFLGSPFPQGMKILAEHDESLVPWAWAMNCVASVLAINVTSLLVGVVPISSFFLVAIACYAGSYLLFGRAMREVG